MARQTERNGTHILVNPPPPHNSTAPPEHTYLPTMQPESRKGASNPSIHPSTLQVSHPVMSSSLVMYLPRYPRTTAHVRHVTWVPAGLLLLLLLHPRRNCTTRSGASWRAETLSYLPRCSRFGIFGSVVRWGSRIEGKVHVFSPRRELRHRRGESVTCMTSRLGCSAHAVHEASRLSSPS
jgi:hypothetical protein